MHFTNIKNNILVRVIVAVMVALMFVFMPQASMLMADSANATIIQVNNYVNLRTVPSTKGDVIIQVPLRYRVTVVEQVAAQADDESGCSAWYKIMVTRDGTTYTGYVASKYIQQDTSTEVSSDTAFEQAIALFPESYKPYLRNLHELHPQWIFYPEFVNAEWETVLDKETVNGVSLIQNTVDPAWQSTAYTGVIDSPNWVNASRGIVAYYMDPRNQMTESLVFQFADLNYDDYSIEPSNVGKVLTGTFMAAPTTALYNSDTQFLYEDIFAFAGSVAADGPKGVNPIFLASHAIQECGIRGSSSSNGATGYYNFYNIGAYSDSINAARHGLTLAKSGLTPEWNATYEIPWNTPGKSIINGAKWIYNNYISKGQDTLYYIRFNVSPKSTSSLGKHQYMTATQSVSSEGQRMYEAYKASGLLNSAINFIIPIYQNMPTDPCIIPITPAQGNAVYSDLAPFVTQLYNGVLGRDPDADGLQNWINAINNGTFSGPETAAAFCMSPEMVSYNLSNEEYVRRLYRVCFNREADPDGLATWTGLLAQHYTREYIVSGFVNSGEFMNLCSRYGINTRNYVSSTTRGLTPNREAVGAFVNRLYELALGRNADPDGFATWTGILMNGGGNANGYFVSSGFIFSAEMNNMNLSNEEYVTRLYRIFLDREPDPDGFATWTGLLNEGATRQRIFDGFVYSAEFANRCLDAGFYPYPGYQL